MSNLTSKTIHCLWPCNFARTAQRILFLVPSFAIGVGIKSLSAPKIVRLAGKKAHWHPFFAIIAAFILKAGNVLMKGNMNRFMRWISIQAHSQSR